MADVSPVNGAITDSVTQIQAAILGLSSGQSASMLDAVMAETLGMAMHNAVTAQQNSQMVSSAAVTSACARMINAVPPAPPPPAKAGGTSGTPPTPSDIAAIIARDTQEASKAIGALVQDAGKASGSAETAAKNLAKLSDQAEKGVPPKGGGDGSGAGGGADSGKGTEPDGGSSGGGGGAASGA